MVHATRAVLVLVLVGACAETEPRPVDVRAPVTVVPAQPPDPAPGVPSAPAPACPAQPEIARQATATTCTNTVLRSGQTFRDQLTVQLSSGAFAVMDCPRMRYRGQDTPVCVTRETGGRTRGACCPPGTTDPADPACVAEGTLDGMFKRQRVWEWCSKDAPPRAPCDPCVWVTGAER